MPSSTTVEVAPVVESNFVCFSSVVVSNTVDVANVSWLVLPSSFVDVTGMVTTVDVIRVDALAVGVVPSEVGSAISEVASVDAVVAGRVMSVDRLISVEVCLVDSVVAGCVKSVGDSTVDVV